MDNQTKNTALVICAVLITASICISFITNQIDRYQIKNFLSNSVNNLFNTNKELRPKEGEILISSWVVQDQLDQIKKLRKQNSKLLSENKRLKHRFRYQLDAEKQKANIKWSDGSSKPKYNQVQEGIGRQ